MHSSRMRTVRSSDRISGGGGCLLWGVSAPGGYLLWGVSAPGGVSALGGSAPGGVCSRGCLLWGGVCSQGGVVSQHALRQTPPPPCGQTDACKNITFATSLRTVNMSRKCENYINVIWFSSSSKFIYRCKARGQNRGKHR